MDLVTAIYDVTASFPTAERFGLVAQLRRASVSIPSNIAEGFGRRNRPEFQRFIRNARGSCCEAETQIEIAARLRFIDADRTSELLDQITEVGRILSGLHASLEPGERAAAAH